MRVAARTQHALDVDPSAAHLAHEVRDLRGGRDHRHAAAGSAVITARSRQDGKHDKQGGEPGAHVFIVVRIDSQSSRGRLPRLVDPLELIAFCAWCFAVALAGGVVGLVLGNIRLPAVLLVASHPAAGAGANIGISGVAALAAAIVHVRAGRINWRLFAWMAPPSMVGAVAGGYLSGLLPDTALLDLDRRGARVLRHRPAARAQ